MINMNILLSYHKNKMVIIWLLLVSVMIS